MESRVLDGMTIGSTEYQRRLKHLKNDISDSGIEITFDFSIPSWNKLSSFIQKFPAQLNYLVGTNSNFAHIVEKHTEDVELALIDISGSCTSLVEVKDRLLPIIIEKVGNKETPDKKKLFNSFKEYSKLCDSNDELHVAIIEYYSQFIPHSKKCETIEVGALSRIFKAIVDVIKKILKNTRDMVKQTWEIINDPDTFYLELRGRLENYFKAHPSQTFKRYLLFLPDLFRLYIRLLVDNRVPNSSKQEFFGALVYLVVPIDLIPEQLLGPIGYIEDIYFMILAIINMLNTNRIPREVLDDHWLGSKDDLDFLIKTSMELSENIDLFRYLGDWFRDRMHQPSF
jgi:uncharacterized membrane protein YkvA (DUF1232 family)